jgi:hypothetical protein
MARISAGGEGIRVYGLSELNKALRDLSNGAQRELRDANVRIAKKEGERAQAAAYSLGGVAAHVAPSVKGGGSTTWAGIKFGSGQPAAMGAEFGGRGRPTTQQFQPWRGHEGYFVFPTIRRDSESITRDWTESITDLMKRNGL